MELTGKRYARRDWRKLLSTRRGSVLVGLGCAALAGVVLVVAMQRYRHSVDASGNPLTVLVATQRIPKNTAGDVIASGGLFKATQIVAKQASAGAVADAAAIQGKVTVRDIFPGEQLTAADFSGGGLPAQLSPPERAMTLALDSQHGMVASLHDGDHVDLYGTVSISGSLGRNEPVERLLVRNIRVLKAGGDNSGGGSGLGSGGNNSTSDVTLDVPDRDVWTVSYAQDNGKVWLALRGAGATDSNVPSLMTAQAWLLGSSPIINGGGK